MAITQVSNSLVKQDLTISGGTVDNTVIGSGTPAAGTFTTVAGALASTVTGTTAAASDNSTKIATTAYVTTALANLVDSAPGTLNTLNELAAALGDDASFSTTVTTSIAAKLPLAGGTLTGATTINGGNPALVLSNSGDAKVNFVRSSNTINYAMATAASGGHGFYDNAGSAYDLYMKAGNVGIGTTSLNTYSNQTVLTINGTNYGRVDLEASGTLKGSVFGGGDGLNLDAGVNQLVMFAGGSEAMRIDSSGRVGVGGTPNTNWRNDATDDVLMLGTEATLHSDAGVTTELWNNAYVDNSDTFKNISTRGASRYMQYSGAHKWFTAASASAGSTISTEINSTPKMTLDVSGNLGIGTSSPSAKLHVSGGVKATDLIAHDSTGINLQTDEGTKRLIVEDGGAVKLAASGFFYADYIRGVSDVNTGINMTGSDVIQFQTGGVERFLLSDEAVINEAGADYNFRVESTGLAFMFFVDAGNNAIGIGRQPSSVLIDAQTTSSGTATALRLRNSGQVANSAVKQVFSLNRDGSDVDFEAAAITVGKEQNWTTTGSTIDSYMAFNTVLNETSTERLKIDSNGTIFGGNYFFQVDTDTGILRSSTNELSIRCGGNDRWVVTTSGVSTSGSLSKGSGSFKIDHPLPAKTDTHHLVHSFVEAPQADNIYRGSVDLVGGSATVNIDTAAGMTDGTFVLLNTNVQCFTSNESGWTAIKGSVSGNNLTITAQDNSCTDTISWMVVGERHDQHMKDTDWTDSDGKVIVEPEKT